MKKYKVESLFDSQNYFHEMAKTNNKTDSSLSLSLCVKEKKKEELVTSDENEKPNRIFMMNIHTGNTHI